MPRRPTTATRAATAAADTRANSALARQLFDDLMRLPADVRRGFIAELDERDLAQVLTVATKEGGTPYALWRDDPVGFVEQVCGETLWSTQRQILTALESAAGPVAVPSCFGSGKTWLAGRATAWFSCVHPPGTALTVTTATRFRQVVRQIWPMIRRVATAARLPGQVDATVWKMLDENGLETVVAYGFTAPPYDESAVQGVHSANLLVLVDEGGGLGRTIGSALRGLMVGGAKLLVIGNPPTDDEGSWFEGLCTADRTVTITVPAASTPNFTGERVGRCRTCPPAAGEHTPAIHLIDPPWVEDTVREYGADSSYVEAKVHARFPKGGPSRIIPAGWVDAAVQFLEPDDRGGYRRLCDLGAPGEDSDLYVREGAWVRLGVDVAADGGDEFVVARAIGDLITIVHVSSGPANSDALNVAGEVLTQIKQAQMVAAALGSTAPVHVKLDGIGLGWGIGSTLKGWAAEGMHQAVIHPIIVSEKPDHDDEAARMRPANKRAELWIAGRHLLEPESSLRLAVDRRTAAQLASPRYGTGADGRTVIESKKSMRARRLPSPDRAEAVLLSLYQPRIRRRLLN